MTIAYEWPAEAVALLTSFWKSGLSAREVGEKIGKTRNAVIGKLHRLGFTARHLPPRPPRTPTVRKPKPSAHKSDMSPPIEIAPAVNPVTLFDLERESCRWPINDGYPQFYFCGKQREGNSPYCLEHFNKAYHHKPNGAHR